MADLKLFILRAESLKLYREFLRLIGRAPEHVRADLRQQVRREFDASSRGGAPPQQLGMPQQQQQQQQRDHKQPPPQQDAYVVKYALSDGRARLKQLREMLSLSE